MNRAGLILADDNTAMLEKAAGMLTPEFEVLGKAADGQAALELVEQLEPDLLVLDISMPVLGGFAVATKLAENGSATPIVFLTVHEDPAYVRKALCTGGLGYVIKRRMDADLARAVRSALTGCRFVSPGIELLD